MTKNNSYPLQLVKAFRAGEITRQQFINEFRAWQKSNGINFDCKGTADSLGVHVEYRGTTATIHNGILCWKNNTAKTIFEFCRKVDFSKQREGALWS